MPWIIVNTGIVDKGRRDCGNHAFYKSDDRVDHCYYCAVGVRLRAGSTDDNSATAKEPPDPDGLPTHL